MKATRKNTYSGECERQRNATRRRWYLSLLIYKDPTSSGAQHPQQATASTKNAVNSSSIARHPVYSPATAKVGPLDLSEQRTGRRRAGHQDTCRVSANKLTQITHLLIASSCAQHHIRAHANTSIQKQLQRKPICTWGHHRVVPNIPQSHPTMPQYVDIRLRLSTQPLAAAPSHRPSRHAAPSTCSGTVSQTGDCGLSMSRRLSLVIVCTRNDRVITAHDHSATQNIHDDKPSDICVSARRMFFHSGLSALDFRLHHHAAAGLTCTIQQVWVLSLQNHSQSGVST